MRILLTGATGFIGAAFLREATLAGHEVAALVRPERVAALTGQASVRPLTGTLADAPWGDITAFAPDVCVHTAWVTTPGSYLESPENELFLAWSQAFLRRAMDAGVAHLVTLGTCIEYAMTGTPLSETATPLAPVSPYAGAKDALRRWQDTKAAARGVRAAWARVFYPYGPGEHPTRLATSIVQRLRRGEPVTLKTAASVKDYLFISDLATALLTVVAGRFHGPVNLGTGEGVTVGALAGAIAGQLGRPDLLRVAEPGTPDPYAYVVADAARLRALGWQPRVSLAQGVAQLLGHLPA
ncbi:MAG: NAD(P)-dependent oxidoreductase [Verrucomicrobia bacterium]|nr:NAD(P)-dependent oxidoreductase [Verrucomicrobiota bacterium]